MGHADGSGQDHGESNNDRKMYPIYAKAKFPFDGRNNDELSFRKGDVIAVTQQLDGGWWEGTLGTNTGWFPSGYVILLNDSERAEHLGKNIGLSENSGEQLEHVDGGNESSLQVYRKQITEGFLESECTYLREMTEFYNDVLSNLNSEGMIVDNEMTLLTGNLKSLIAYQQEIFNKIKDAVSKDSSSAKIGGILLTAAPSIRELVREYCQNHPSAIDVVLKNKENYSKFGGGIKTLITGLSKPFRHLEKYAITLNELDRSMNGTNADKGNTQRAAAVFRDIANLCTSIRKQKEMQLELKNSGLIEGMSESEIETLGSIIYMGAVTLGDEETLVEEQLPVDRCLVLFPTTLLVLEITQALNTYVLKRKVNTEGMKVKRIEPKLTLSLVNSDRSFDTLMTVSFTEELQRWIEAFCSCAGVEVDGSCVVPNPASPQKYEISEVRNVSELSPPRKAEVSQMPIPSKAEKGRSVAGFRVDHELEMILPDNGPEKEDQVREQIKVKNKTKLYSGYTLRPYPVVRGNWAVDYSKKVNIKLRKSASQLDQEDAYLLRIVEGYCDIEKYSKAARSASVGYVGNQPPQLIVAEDEKILVEEMIGDEVVVQEKSLVDTVYSLRDHMINMQKEIRHIASGLEREQKLRRRLEEFVRMNDA